MARKRKEEIKESASLPPSSEEEDVKPLTKRSRAKKAAAKSEADSQAPEPAKKTETKSKSPGKETGSKALGDRWEARQPSLLIKPNAAAQGGKKIAAFDLDGTMAVVKGKAPFPKDAGDWKFFNKTVPRVIHEYADQGYQIVIFSNQGIIKHALTGAGSEKTRARVDNVLAGLTIKEKHIEAQVFLATSDDSFRKPLPGMWNLFVEEFNGGVKPDLKKSFYCGDMAGRLGDLMKNDQPSATDKEFAEAVGIAFKTPEEVFGEGDAKKELAQKGSTGLNTELADAFRQLADLCRSNGENFKAQAFDKVHNVISAFPSKITATKELNKVAGVGKSSLSKIDEFLKTGKLAALEEAGVKAPETKESLQVDKFLNL